MRNVSRVSHNPQECAIALLGTRGPVVIDLETTGLRRHNSIVSVGFLVDDIAFILFVASSHLSVAKHQIQLQDLRQAMKPLTEREDLVVVFHNAVFDLGFLDRINIRIAGQIDDTMKLLQLIDPDRKTRANDSIVKRFDRHSGLTLDYRLKSAVLSLLDISAPNFPGRAEMLPYLIHVIYLICDLLSTRSLHEHIQSRMSPTDAAHNREMIRPITPLLVKMQERGVCPNRSFIESEFERILGLMKQCCSAHQAIFGQRVGVKDSYLRNWIYFDQKGLRCRIIRRGKKRLPTLRRSDLLEIREESTQQSVRDSLALIADYLLLRSLMQRLGSLTNHISFHERFHSIFNDTQASGRVSSSNPNLQQVAGEVAEKRKNELVSDLFRNERIRSRNALVASPGHRLIAFDISQADIRVLAHLVESFRFSEEEFIENLHQERNSRLSQKSRQLQQLKWKFFQHQNQKVKQVEDGFDPSKPCRLAEDFRRKNEDFYSVVTERMLGRPPKPGTSERSDMKQIILGIVNGKSARTLSKDLKVSLSTAKNYMAKFADAYPQVDRFTQMQHHALAITGTTHSFRGRHRRVSPHYWMVSENEIEINLAYSNADKLWVRVIPLRPDRHTLTCFVVSVIDAKKGSPNKGLEIYHHQVGWISKDTSYRFFDDSGLLFRLPIRNISWRNIRKVRTRKEEAVYEGFDKTRRSLFNHLCQGGTADIAKTMMIRSQPVCEKFDAHLILQIHDELVFEVPMKQSGKFTRMMKKVLERPPTEDFRVPIVVEPKIGTSFGQMRELSPTELSDWWFVRFSNHLRSWIKDLWKRMSSKIRNIYK